MDVVGARTRGVVLALAVLVGVVGAGRAAAQPLPTLTAPVNDFANVIDPADEAALDQHIRALLAASGDTIVVVTIGTFEPYATIEDYAVALFEQAGIGDRELDRGLLVLLAVDERRVRIEVGYGLEEAITDGFAGEVIRQRLLPAFRTGDYGRALVDGVTALARRIGEVRGVAVEGLPDAAPPAAGAYDGPSALQIVLILLVLIALSSLGSGGGPHVRRRGGRWHGGVGGFGGGFGGFGGGGFGGGGGGGFGGFGGGLSGGGGASGRW